MQLLETLDVGLFRFVNQTLSNGLFDWLMPVLSGNALFTPALVFAAVLLLGKGGARGRVFVLLLVLALWLGDAGVCKPLKEVIGRPRPFAALADVQLRVGKGGSASMPSSHAANWAVAAMLTLIYYRRAAWITAFSSSVSGRSSAAGDACCGVLSACVHSTTWSGSSFENRRSSW